MNRDDLKVIEQYAGLALEPILELNALAGRLAGALPEAIVTGDDEMLSTRVRTYLPELRRILEFLNEITVPHGPRIWDNIDAYDIHGDPGDVEVVEDPETEARLAEFREKFKERKSPLPAWAGLPRS